MPSLSELDPRKSERMDRLLMQRIQTGDSDAFELLYQKLKDRITHYALKYTQSQSTAEEITQETFMKVFQFKHTYDPQYEVNSWIWTIAKHVIFDHFKKNRLQKMELLELSELQEGILRSMNCPKTAETLCIEAVEIQQFQFLLKQLPENQRRALEFRLGEDLSYDEISESMNLSVSAVKSLIHRGRRNLMNSHKQSVY
ncbi:MAG: RNA polymerase sigma factor [Bdellovibrionia bacterium]